MRPDAAGPLAAATNVLGVIPLLQDVFWAGLAVKIMAALTIGTGFTMIVVKFCLRQPRGLVSGNAFGEMRQKVAHSVAYWHFSDMLW